MSIEKKMRETENEVNEINENPKYAKNEYFQIKKNMNIIEEPDKYELNSINIENYARKMLNVKKIYDAENTIKKNQIKKMIKRMKNNLKNKKKEINIIKEDINYLKNVLKDIEPKNKK